MQKSERHKVILATVSTGSVINQQQIVEALRNVGFGVTQASVSRDINELSIRKHNGVYAIKSPASGLFNVHEIQYAGSNLLVVRCESGMASALTVKIDAANIRGILGTIAGDDTIFIAVEKKLQIVVDQQVRALFQEGRDEN